MFNIIGLRLIVLVLTAANLYTTPFSYIRCWTERRSTFGTPMIRSSWPRRLETWVSSCAAGRPSFSFVPPMESSKYPTPSCNRNRLISPQFLLIFDEDHHHHHYHASYLTFLHLTFSSPRVACWSFLCYVFGNDDLPGLPVVPTRRADQAADFMLEILILFWYVFVFSHEV